MAFWKPGQLAPGIDRSSENERAPVIFNARARLPIARQRSLLPIAGIRDGLLYALEKHPVVVLVGETGCGKTTQVPQYLDEAGWTAGGRQIAVTQPRRLAAITVAARIAAEMGVPLGAAGGVGYAVRFDARCHPTDTRIKLLTDGMLLRETLSDPTLSRYSVIMLDEAHERSLDTDVLLGLCKKIRRRRRDLRLIVSSATLDAEGFRDFFADGVPGDAAIVGVQGRAHPVDTYYLQRACPSYVRAAAEAIVRIHRHECGGDILAFLPGRVEIDAVLRLVEELREGDSDAGMGRGAHAQQLLCLPLYAELPRNQQLQALAPAPRGARKAVVATNIAETSLTIDGIVHVIDAGFVKLPFFDPRAGVEALLVCAASKASARQRAGRAGRTRPGKCFRLYPESAWLGPTHTHTGTHTGADGAGSSSSSSGGGGGGGGGTSAAVPPPAPWIIPERSVPMMQRSDLTWVVLQLKALGIDDVLHFDFVSPPAPAALARALELLYALGAIDSTGALDGAGLGLAMAQMPLPPQLSRMLLASLELGCSEEALSLAAVLSVQNPFVDPRGRSSLNERLDAAVAELGAREGDHVTFVRVFNEFRDMADADAHEWCQEHMLRARALRRAVEIRAQLARHLRRFATSGANAGRPVALASCGEDMACLRRCVVAGFFCNAVQLHSDGVYRTVRDGRAVRLHPSSVLTRLATVAHPARWLVYHDVVLTEHEYMREVCTINPQWLGELAPHFFDVSARSVSDAYSGDSGSIGVPGAAKRRGGALEGGTGAKKARGGGGAAERAQLGQPPARHTFRLPNAIGKRHHELRSQF